MFGAAVGPGGPSIVMKLSSKTSPGTKVMDWSDEALNSLFPDKLSAIYCLTIIGANCTALPEPYNKIHSVLYLTLRCRMSLTWYQVRSQNLVNRIAVERSFTGIISNYKDGKSENPVWLHAHLQQQPISKRMAPFLSFPTSRTSL